MGDFRIQMVGLDQARSCRCDFPSPALAGMPPFTQQHRSPRAVAISVADPGTCARRNVDAQGEFDDVKSREVEMLFEMYKSKLDALLGLFGTQFTALKTEAQVIVGLCGLAITVTGFSGGNVIRSGSISSGFLVAGIVFVLVSAHIALHVLSHITYISEMLVRDERVWILAAITKRNAVRRSLGFSAFSLAIGLVCYLAAVSIAAVSQGQLITAANE